MKYSTMGKKEPSKLGLHSNVWFRVASCLISGLFTIAIKIADHLRGSRLCLISIHRPDEFTSFQIVSYLHCKFTACWKLKSTDFLKPYTKCNKQLHSNWFSLVMAWQSLISQYRSAKIWIRQHVTWCVKLCPPVEGQLELLGYSIFYCGRVNLESCIQ